MKTTDGHNRRVAPNQTIRSDLTTQARDLVERVRSVVRRQATPRGVADAVAELLQGTDCTTALLTSEQRQPSTDHLAHHVLHAEPDGSFSIVSIVWMPGQRTCIHDHLCWCVTTVIEGEEHETVYELDATRDEVRLLEKSRVINRPGAVVAYSPPSDIHAVANGGADVAISLHLYGADIAKLGTSIRRTYDGMLLARS